MSERPIRTESDGATARADQAARVEALLKIFQEDHEALRRIEMKLDQNNRMVWEIGQRLFGKAARALPQVTVAQAQQWGEQWKKVRELWKNFLSPPTAP